MAMGADKRPLTGVAVRRLLDEERMAPDVIEAPGLGARAYLGTIARGLYTDPWRRRRVEQVRF